MYLSCLLIDLGSNPDKPHPGRMWLRNLYHVHQRLCMAFPSDRRKERDPEFLAPYAPDDFACGQVHVTRAKEAGFLFRIEPQPAGRAVILVQSATEPDWDYAFHNARYLLATPPHVKPFNPTFSVGQVFRFRLRACPTKKRLLDKNGKPFLGKDGKPLRGKNDEPQGRRVPLYKKDEQKKWLIRKSEGSEHAKGGFSGGFEVLECSINGRGTVKSYETKSDPQKKDSGRSNPILGVDFEGILRVTNVEEFGEALKSGIGSGKAFGFGMLSVGRIDQHYPKACFGGKDCSIAPVRR